MAEPALKLIEKYRSGVCTPPEKLLVEAWFMKYGSSTANIQEQEIERVKAEMWQIVQARRNKTVRHLWPRIAVAAAVALIVLGAYLFKYNSQNRTFTGKDLVAQDVAPGNVGATLTLASGKKIRLSDALNGELANEAGVIINKSADGQLVYELKGSSAALNKINTLSTAKGETYQVRLPDGSLVYLNAASSLTYSASLRENGKRIVRLDGEAYFEIVKDKNHPFIVKTDHQQVEVLGTHFNINSYSDEPETRTTLVEGSVRVSNGNTVSLLKPNQQSVLNDHGINIRNVNAEDEISWKDGIFLFQDETLVSIMRRISRWYDVDIVFADGVDKNQLFGGGVSRYNNVSVVLEMLESTKDIHFKVEGRRIFVMK